MASTPSYTTSQSFRPGVAAGPYQASVVITPVPGHTAAGQILQTVGGLGVEQRVALFHVSSAKTITATVRLGGTHDVLRVSTTSSVVVGGLTLTKISPQPMVRGAGFLTPAGQSVTWHGLNASPFEYAADMGSLQQSTHATLVRIPTSECQWLQWSQAYVAGYKQKIVDEVAAANAAGMIAIVDLHWSCRDNAMYKQDGWNTYDQVAPDQHALTFWQDAATTFKNNPGVMFELFNEPQLVDSATYAHKPGDDVWRNGGTVSYYASSWQAPGMQDLYNDIRSTGAMNVVLADGSEWASSLVPAMNEPLDGTNLAYAFHAYTHDGQNPDAHTPYLDSLVWPALNPAGPYAQAGLDTEYGTPESDPGATSYFQDTINWFSGHGIGWTVWGWWPQQNDVFGLLNSAGTAVTSRGQVVQGSF